MLVDAADGTELSAKSLVEELRPQCRIEPASVAVALGQFVREGRRIVLAANVGREPYSGHLTAGTPGTWQVMDPATGSIRPADRDDAGPVQLALDARQAILLVEAHAAGQ
jgi:hypothetical protein